MKDLNALRLVIILVIVFVFSWYFFGIANSIEQNTAPTNSSIMYGAYQNQVGIMATIGHIIPVALVGLGGYVVYRVLVSGGDA